MIWVLYLVAILWGIFGVLALILPKKVKNFSLKLTRSGPYWLWGSIALVMAILFWQSASSISVPLLAQIFAVFAGIKGLFLLILPKSKMDRMLRYWTQISDVCYRVIGVVLLVLAYYIFQMLI